MERGETRTQPLWKVTAILLAVVILGYVAFQVLGADEDGVEKPNFPEGGPVKFLYLDGAEVSSYLAQVNGGSFDSEKVTNKVTQDIGGELAVAGVKANGSRAKEIFVERVLQPTDASAYFALKAGLDDQDEIEGIRLRGFEEEVRPLAEGRFVSFKSSALLPPRYLNAYLAVRQANADARQSYFPNSHLRDGAAGRCQCVNALASMFPESRSRRRATRKFYEEVGRNPRVVFAIQPTDPDDPENKRRLPFVYLLPMSARELTSERSLIKYGGGSFTVVGKMVRRFPERYHDYDPAYIDSPTLETWSQPLLHAPGELLCRTEPLCIKRVRAKDLEGQARRNAAEAARDRILAALRKQTKIEELGAVILPIAIYK